MADHNRALSLKEFSERFGVCLATTYAYIRSGKLRAVKVGRRTVLLAPDVEAWLASLPDFSACPPRGATQARVAKPARRGARVAEQTPPNEIEPPSAA
jgi:excisionase family DNA binding protein